MKKSKRFAKIISFALVLALALSSLGASTALAFTDHYPYYPYAPYYPYPQDNFIPLPINYYPGFYYPPYGYDNYYYNGWNYSNPWVPYYGTAPYIAPPIGYTGVPQSMGNVTVPSVNFELEAGVINQKAIKLRIVGLDEQESKLRSPVEPNKVGTALRFTESLRRDYNGKLVLSMILKGNVDYASCGVLVSARALDDMAAAKLDKFEFVGYTNTFTFDIAKLRQAARDAKTDELVIKIEFVSPRAPEYAAFNESKLNSSVDKVTLHANNGSSKSEIIGTVDYEAMMKCDAQDQSIIVYAKDTEVIKVKGAYTYNNQQRFSYASASVPFGYPVAAYVK